MFPFRPSEKLRARKHDFVSAYLSYHPFTLKAAPWLRLRVLRSSANAEGVIPAVLSATGRLKLVSGIHAITNSMQSPLGTAVIQKTQRHSVVALATSPPKTDPRAGPAPCMNLILIVLEILHAGDRQGGLTRTGPPWCLVRGGSTCQMPARSYQ